MEGHGKGFRITLSPEVPVLIREHLGNGVETMFLADHGYKRADIGSGRYIPAVRRCLRPQPPHSIYTMVNSMRRGIASRKWTVVGLGSGGVEDVMKNRRPAAGTLGILGGDGPRLLFRLLLLEMARGHGKLSQALPTETDVFVVGGVRLGTGGGDHGATTWISRCRCSRARDPLIDKACGEGFLPDGPRKSWSDWEFVFPWARAYPFAAFDFWHRPCRQTHGF